MYNIVHLEGTDLATAKDLRDRWLNSLQKVSTHAKSQMVARNITLAMIIHTITYGTPIQANFKPGFEGCAFANFDDSKSHPFVVPVCVDIRFLNAIPSVPTVFQHNNTEHSLSFERPKNQSTGKFHKGARIR